MIKRTKHNSYLCDGLLAIPYQNPDNALLWVVLIITDRLNNIPEFFNKPVSVHQVIGESVDEVIPIAVKQMQYEREQKKIENASRRKNEANT